MFLCSEKLSVLLPLLVFWMCRALFSSSGLLLAFHCRALFVTLTCFRPLFFVAFSVPFVDRSFSSGSYILSRSFFSIVTTASLPKTMNTYSSFKPASSGWPTLWNTHSLYSAVIVISSSFWLSSSSSPWFTSMALPNLSLAAKSISRFSQPADSHSLRPMIAVCSSSSVSFSMIFSSGSLVPCLLCRRMSSFTDWEQGRKRSAVTSR